VSDRRPLLLAGGDLLALLVFALVGLASHDEGLTTTGLARTWLPIAGCYTLAALVVRAWTRPGIWRTACAWLLGVAGGVLVRALLLGRPLDGDQLQLLAVALAVTLVLLLAWRTAESLVRRRRAGATA
jgi:hypothetical protein